MFHKCPFIHFIIKDWNLNCSFKDVWGSLFVLFIAYSVVVFFVLSSTQMMPFSTEVSWGTTDMISSQKTLRCWTEMKKDCDLRFISIRRRDKLSAGGRKSITQITWMCSIPTHVWKQKQHAEICAHTQTHTVPETLNPSPVPFKTCQPGRFFMPRRSSSHKSLFKRKH